MSFSAVSAKSLLATEKLHCFRKSFKTDIKSGNRRYRRNESGFRITEAPHVNNLHLSVLISRFDNIAADIISIFNCYHPKWIQKYVLKNWVWLRILRTAAKSQLTLCWSTITADTVLKLQNEPPSTQLPPCRQFLVTPSFCFWRQIRWELE